MSAPPQGAALAAAGGGGATAAPFAGPAADSWLGELLLDVLPLACAVGFALDLSRCTALCGTTWRRGDRGATNDMMVCALRLQAPWLAAARRAPRAARGRTSMMLAAAVGDERRVRELLAAGAPLRCSDVLAWTALHFASAQENASIVAELLEADAAASLQADAVGAMVDAQDSISGATPLMLASTNGHEGAARALLARDAPQDTSGCAALHAALGVAAADSVSAGALMRRDYRGRTPLALAILSGNVATEAVLRAHGAS
jgi:hypothetical protein